jgi:hypothetical protein
MKTPEQMTQEDFTFINAVMCNDEVSPNEKLISHFQKELAISKRLAVRIVSFRGEALNELDFDIQFYLEGGT